MKSYVDYSNLGKCLYFVDFTSRAEIVKFFRWYFSPNDDNKRTF